MEYTPTVYANNNPPALNADNLNNMEQGIYDNSVEIENAKEEISVIANDSYTFSEMSVYATADGWRLLDTGLCVSDSNYTLKKYKVTAGTKVKVVSDYKFQFQNAANVPASGTPTRVGVTYKDGVYLVEVPTGATYLIISTLKNSITYAAYLGVSKNDAEENNIAILETTKAIKSVVGFNVWDEQWETNSGNTYIMSKNFIEVIPGEKYYFQAPANPSSGFIEYDANKEVITTRYPLVGIVTMSSTTRYVKFRMAPSYGMTYNNDICFNLSQPNTDIEPHNGQYLPYGYLGNYKDVLNNKAGISDLVKELTAESKNTADTFLNVSEATGTALKNVSEHPHGTVIKQSNSQTDIRIPKNYTVTITLSDANVTGNGIIYVKYKNSESKTTVIGSWTYNGSYTFTTTDETEYFSLYKDSNVTAGTMTITLTYHYSDQLIGLPLYYVDHMISKVATIRNNMMDAGINGETFVFISDLHWDNNVKNSPKLVKYILDNLNVNYLLCGGDVINEGLKDTMAKTMVECIRAFCFKNIFLPCAFGNHDSNKNGGNSSKPERWFDENAEYALMQKQAEKNITYFTTTGWNFYFDAKQTKTRWIVCDTQENGTFTWYDELCALLNETPDGYKVIVSGHWFYDSGAKSTFATNLEIIVDAFNAKTTVTIDLVEYDFTNAKGFIPFVIGGHMHKDMDWTTEAGIPFILSDCDNGPRSSNTDYPYVKGTITEQAFDVVTVDYENQTVKCVRVGRGADRTFNYGE